jgi:hypothetical protein
VATANDTKNSFIYNDNWFGSAMAFLENLESSIPEANTKIEKIIDTMKNDPDHQELMKKLAEYEERIKYMEDHGI